MTMNLYLKCLAISLTAVILSLFPEQASHSQKAGQARFVTAVRRSENAAKTIKIITGMSEDETIPQELLRQARAIGVFPDVVKMNLLFSQGMKGYGVICSRQPQGWSLPAYYAFGSSEINLKMASFKSFDLIVLFMNENTVNWFQEGRLELKGIRAGVAGPVGKLAGEGRAIRGFNVIIYTLIDGKLKGMDVESDFFDAAVINPDNNINKAVYGMKGREVLQGKAPTLPQGAAEVAAFRDILNERFADSR